MTKKNPETAIAYKGFDSNLSCRGFQYEVGKTFTHEGPVVQCESGFHVCQNPLDVLDFYPLISDDGANNRFARVEIGGKIDRSDDKKWASAEITVVAELALPALIADAIKFVMALAKGSKNVQAASGDSSQLAASGYYSKLAIEGKNSAAATVGPNSQIKGVDGTLIAICEYNRAGKPVGFVTGIIGINGLKADTYYRAQGGKLVEV